MSLPGFTRQFRPLEILTEEQLERIHQGVLNTLENTGIRIEHERARKLCEKNGAAFVGKRVKRRTTC
jgi:trimethylamine:corrinoid methyltransferase-like protein